MQLWNNARPVDENQDYPKPDGNSFGSVTDPSRVDEDKGCGNMQLWNNVRGLGSFTDLDELIPIDREWITIDSGACDNVFPEACCPDTEIEYDEGYGVTYHGPSGEPVYDDARILCSLCRMERETHSYKEP